MKRIYTLLILSVLLFAAGDTYAQRRQGGNDEGKRAASGKKKKKKMVPKSKGRQNDHHRRHETHEPRFTMAVKVGGNFQYMMDEGHEVFDNWIKPGYLVGMYFNYEKRMFGFQPEGMVKTCRYYLPGDGALHLRTTQIDLPLLLSFRPLGIVPILDRVKIVAGPQIQFMAFAEKANRVDWKNNFTAADVAAALGLEIDLPLNIHVGVRGLYGLTNVNNTRPSREWYNHSIQATLGFRLLN